MGQLFKKLFCAPACRSEITAQEGCSYNPSDTRNNCNRGMKLCFLNTQGLQSKHQVLEVFIDKELPDVLCLSEHWLRANEAEFYKSLSYLQMAGAWFRTRLQRGGTAVYARNSLHLREVNLSQFCREQDLELAAVELIGESTLILSVYRSPSGVFGNFIELLDSCLHFLRNRYKVLIIGGDYNIHFEKDVDDNKTAFLNLVSSYGLCVSNREPTRLRACLDTIVTDLPACAYEIFVVEPLVADHSAVIMKVPYRKKREERIIWAPNYVFQTRKVNNETIIDFKNSLAEVNWSNLYRGNDPLSKFELVFETINLKFNDYFPVLNMSGPKKVRKRTDKSWYTEDLRQVRLNVLLLYDCYKQATDSSSDSLYRAYLKLKKEYKQKISSAKKSFNRSFIQNAHNPCKAAWQIVNAHRVKQARAAHSLSPDEFNTFFLNSVEEILNEIPNTSGSPADRITRVEHCIFSNWRQVSPEDIVRIVGGFKPSSSPDVYGLSPAILKAVINELAVPIANVINECLGAGIFPGELKLSRTVPVFKKGDPSIVSNYRPISIVPAFGKIVESVMNEQLMEYFEENQLFNQNQHGFRRGKSTTTALLSLAREISEAFEDGQSTALTLCDLSRAFDCVSHPILLSKLRNYGVCGVALQSCQEYLGNRQQCVSLLGASSTTLPVVHGVPQGSVLGPLLFLIMVNDMNLGGRSLLYADDTTLRCRGPTPAAARMEAESLLVEATEWFIENRFLLNADKTQRMACSLQTYVPLAEGEPVKLLGFVIDRKLTWAPHTASICSKLARVIFLLRKLKHLVDKAYLVTVYHALFHSHINYGILLWGHSPGSKDILLLQKKAVRIISSSGWRDHCKPLFSSLGILTVYGQYILGCLLHMRNNVDAYPRRNEVHHHNTRNANRLEQARCRLTRSQLSFPNVAVKYYNALPAHVQDLSVSKFRSVVTLKMKSSPLYSLSEFDELDWSTP